MMLDNGTNEQDEGSAEYEAARRVERMVPGSRDQWERIADLSRETDQPLTILDGPDGAFPVITNQLIVAPLDRAVARELVEGIGLKIVEEELDEALGLARLRLEGREEAFVGVLQSRAGRALTSPNSAVVHAGWKIKDANPASVPVGSMPPRDKRKRKAKGVPIAVIDGAFGPAQSRSDGWLRDVTWPSSPFALDAFVPNGLDPGAGHGTFVVGVVQQAYDEAEVQLFEGLNSLGIGNEWDLANHIASAGRTCKVINCSWGFDGFSLLAGAAVRAAISRLDKDVLVVAAAGNDAKTWGGVPAGLSSVIAVGSLKPGTSLPSSFTRTGPWVDFACSGERVISTFVEGDAEPPSTARFGPDPIAEWTGTSFSTPKVAGWLAKQIGTGRSPHEAADDLRALAVAETGPPTATVGYRLTSL